MFNSLKILLSLTRMDFTRRYLGTLLGAAWSILLPLTTIVLIYFVLTYGLKAGGMGNVSFASWLIPGMLAWFFIGEGIGSGTTAITDYPYLVTKTVFPVYILIPARLASAMPVHFFLMLAFMVYLTFSSQEISPAYWIQLFYYFGCACFLMTGLNLITSSAQVFVKDFSNIISVGLQIFFWATPLFWNPEMLEGTPFKWILLSPFNYIVTGYRESLFNGTAFWSHPVETAVFWIISLLSFFFGFFIFTKTRPHFADVL